LVASAPLAEQLEGHRVYRISVSAIYIYILYAASSQT